MDHNGIRRKITHARSMIASRAPKGAAKAWKLALARACRDAIELDLDITELRQDRRSLAEILELPPERALIAMLTGPAEGLGLLVMSADTLAAIVERQMVGKVSTAPALPRRPTRTDAAMVSDLIETALLGLEAELEGDGDLVWTSGFHYASFLEDARPLGLLLEDITYQTLLAQVSIAAGAKTGTILLALPADGRGRQPQPAHPQPRKAAEMVFAAALGEQVMEASAELTAVLARIKLPLEAIIDLAKGEVLPLGAAAIDQINIETLNGTRLAGGKLGQNRGMRAIRLSDTAVPAARITQTGSKLHTAMPPSAVQKAG